MSYYDTIDDDVKRAKEILAKGREEIPDADGDKLVSEVPVIYGADIYAAYKLLESFVAEIEARGSIIELYERQLAKRDAEKRQR